MNEKLFDNYVKDKLSNYASPVPEGLWEKISKEKNRRPVGFWWNSPYTFIIGLLFITLTIGGFMFWQEKNTTPLVIEANTKEEGNHLASNNKNATVEKSTSSSNNKVTALQNVEPTNPKAVENIEKYDNKASLATVPEKQPLNKKTNLITSFTANNNRKNKVQKELLPNSHLQKSSLAFVENKQPTTSVKNDDILFAFSKADLINISLKKTLNAEKLMPGLNFSLLKPRDCPEVNGKHRNDWYLETYAAPEYTIKKVTSTGASTTYLAKKDSAETMRGGFTIGARISKNITENLLVKAGLQISQLNERVTLRRENERRVTTVVTIHTITDASGNTTTVSDTSTIIQIGYAVSNAYNYYRNIELPVSLSYEFGNKSFKTAINGGVILNLASWYQGKIMDTALQLVNITPKENDVVYKQKVGLSLYGSVSFIKSLNDNADLFAEPYFRYSLTNMQNNAYGFSQRFSALGLSLGVRLKLNTKKQHY